MWPFTVLGRMEAKLDTLLLGQHYILRALRELGHDKIDEATLLALDKQVQAGKAKLAAAIAADRR